MDLGFIHSIFARIPQKICATSDHCVATKELLETILYCYVSIILLGYSINFIGLDLSNPRLVPNRHAKDMGEEGSARAYMAIFMIYAIKLWGLVLLSMIVLSHLFQSGVRWPHIVYYSVQAISAIFIDQFSPVTECIYCIISSYSWCSIFYLLYSAANVDIDRIYTLEWGIALYSATAMSFAGNLSYELALIQSFPRKYRWLDPYRIVMLSFGVLVWALMVPLECIIRYQLSDYDLLSGAPHLALFDSVLKELQHFNTVPTRLEGFGSSYRMVYLVSMTVVHLMANHIIYNANVSAISDAEEEKSKDWKKNRKPTDIPSDAVEVSLEEAIAIQEGWIKPKKTNSRGKGEKEREKKIQ